MMHRIFMLSAAMGLLALPAFAAEGDKPRGERFQKMLEKFDADGDGVLSKEERQAAREARGVKGDKAGRRAKMLEKFDADGDGKLSESERATARAAMAERRGSARRGRPGRGPGGGPLRAMMADPQQAFQLLDKDSDGVLNQAEFQAMLEDIKRRAPGRGRGPKGPGRPGGGPPERN